MGFVVEFIEIKQFTEKKIKKKRGERQFNRQIFNTQRERESHNEMKRERERQRERKESFAMPLLHVLSSPKNKKA